jgi:regulator of protease activity HflC (stomatin/prohibitin superfamily)
MGSVLGCVSVEESSVIALERFGKFETLLDPGLHFFNPVVYQTRAPLSLRLQSTSFKIETITKESLSVLINVGVQYLIDNTEELQSVVVDVHDDGDDDRQLVKGGGCALTRHQKLYKAIYSVTDPKRQIEQHIDSYFRSFAAKHTLAELLLSQTSLSGEILEKLNTEMNPFGYTIYRCLVTDIDPPEIIKASMNTVLSSQNKRQAMINEAEGKKAAAILEAEGLSEVKRLEGIGLSQQRQALAEGLKETMGSFGQKVTEMENGSLTSTIITMQYIDMLNHAAMNGGNTFILSSNPLAGSHIEDQLKTNLLSTQTTMQVNNNKMLPLINLYIRNTL